MPFKIFRQESSGQEKKRVILGIAAGKGGVGKSAVTVNLALALQRLGKSVGILDADIYGPSIRKMLPEDQLPTQKGPSLVPAIAKGIKTISMAYFRNANEATVLRAPIVNGIISQFMKQVDWGNLDYLLIDFPPGTGDIQLTLCQQASLTAAIMVTTPQEVALLDVRKAMDMFHQVKIPILGIVENMSFFYHQKCNEKIYIFGQEGGARLAQENGVPLLGQIPIHPDIARAGDCGESLFALSGQSSWSPFISLAEQVELQIRSLEESNPFELVWKEMPIGT